MSKVDDARSAVNAINGDLDSPRRFTLAYAKIVEAGKTVKEVERIPLQNITINLIGKMRVGASFDKLRESASGFVDDLTVAIVGTGMANIAARNQELSEMLAVFGEHIEAANADANRLQQITANINKATEAIKTVKTLVSQLSSADANANAKIQAVITALEDLDEIF